MLFLEHTHLRQIQCARCQPMVFLMEIVVLVFQCLHQPRELIGTGHDNRMVVEVATIHPALCSNHLQCLANLSPAGALSSLLLSKFSLRLVQHSNPAVCGVTNGGLGNHVEAATDSVDSPLVERDLRLKHNRANGLDLGQVLAKDCQTMLAVDYAVLEAGFDLFGLARKPVIQKLSMLDIHVQVDAYTP